MKVFIKIGLVLFFLINLNVIRAQQNQIIELNNNWSFYFSDSIAWYPATVPGCIHTDLINNNLIDNPFYRTNEKKLQWIDKRDWVYNTKFIVDTNTLKKNKIQLHFKGIDTFSDIYLNDSLILTTDNMFRIWNVNVKGVLKEDNTLKVVLKSPTSEGLKKWIEYGYPLPASNDQSQNGGMGNYRVSPFVRKAPYHFGWDWGPRLVTSGIWNSIELFAYDDVKFEDIYIYNQKISNEKAIIVADIELSNTPTESLKVLVFNNNNLLAVQSLFGNEKKYSVSFSIDNPELWFPNEIGQQKLYPIKFKIVKDNQVLEEKEIKYGIRTIELITKYDSYGETFYFKVNGKPFFAKGVNYIPNDVFLNDVSPEKYEYIIKSAAESHMNMIRVWGGGIYEKEIFYDLCDKYGLLVWQDFMYACSMYPGNNNFLNNVKTEAIQQIKRLRNHPCIALWCGNNEIEIAWANDVKGRGWGWKERYNHTQRKEIWKAYDTLFHHILKDAVEQYQPDVNYWSSSPSAGSGKLSSDNATESGDMHYWGVWHGNQPFSAFHNHVGRFMSEYGFQSFPEYNSINQYTIKEDHEIESEVMTSHQRSNIGNLRIKSYMENHYNIPNLFDDFIYVGQLLQAKGIKEAITAHRSKMPYCMGTLYWQLNDCWPVASWSSIDYYGRWKALQYTVKEMYKNTSFLKTYENDNPVLYLVSDYRDIPNTKVNLTLLDFKGNIIHQLSYQISVEAGAPIKIDMQSIKNNISDEILNNCVLWCQAFSGKDEEELDEELIYFAKEKDMQLPKVEKINMYITENDKHFEINLSSAKIVKNIFLYLDENEGVNRFSNNFFDMLPHKTYIVRYPKHENIDSFRKKIRYKYLNNMVNK